MNKQEMKYSTERTAICLYKGTYNNYKFAIMNFGSHPCCYVFLPKEHKYYGKNYDDIDICCHGGLTYSGDDLIYNPLEIQNTWVIGWDYAHCNDYMGYYDLDCLKKFDHSKYKKWTTDELFEDVKKVIEQL